MEFPNQQGVAWRGAVSSPLQSGTFDMRAHLNPRRLTIAMWDQAFLLRHQTGESFADWDRVLDEAIERGYNTLRLDPLVESIDLEHPEREQTWRALDWPYLPWNWIREITCPAGRWLIEFMQKAITKGLWISFSSWWSHDDSTPVGTVVPEDTLEGAELWSRLLRGLRREVGLDHIVFVDFANEMPYFFPGFLNKLGSITPGGNSQFTGEYSPEAKTWLREQLDKPIMVLQAEFPMLRFTHSIHGDPRWLSVGLKQLDCLDVHFFADADPRWSARTGFPDLTKDGSMFKSDAGYLDFSQRCDITYRSVGAMLLARQRNVMRQFSAWAEEQGMPLMCSEGWSSWFYIDHPDLNWDWLIEWSEASIDNAIEYNFWGVTPNNYCQPQFELWRDIRFHRRLNERFLAS